MSAHHYLQPPAYGLLLTANRSLINQVRCTSRDLHHQHVFCGSAKSPNELYCIFCAEGRRACYLCTTPLPHSPRRLGLARHRLTRRPVSPYDTHTILRRCEPLPRHPGGGGGLTQAERTRLALTHKKADQAIAAASRAVNMPAPRP